MPFNRFKVLYSQNKSIAYLTVWLSTAPVITTLISGYYLLQFEDLIRGFDQWQWIGVFALTAITMAFAVTPTTYIALTAGYFLGITSIFYVIAAYQMASVIGYFLTRYLNSEFIDNLVRLYPKTKAYIDNIGDKQTVTTVLARLSPALPFAMMNVVLSIANISVRNFFVAGFLGMLPRTLFFVWLGSRAQYLESALNQNSSLILSVTLTALLMYLMYKVIKPKAS